jgi:hypothetical protein
LAIEVEEQAGLLPLAGPDAEVVVVELFRDGEVEDEAM